MNHEWLNQTEAEMAYRDRVVFDDISSEECKSVSFSEHEELEIKLLTTTPVYTRILARRDSNHSFFLSENGSTQNDKLRRLSVEGLPNTIKSQHPPIKSEKKGQTFEGVRYNIKVPKANYHSAQDLLLSLEPPR